MAIKQSHSDRHQKKLFNDSYLGNAWHIFSSTAMFSDALHSSGEHQPGNKKYAGMCHFQIGPMLPVIQKLEPALGTKLMHPCQ